MKLNKLEPLPGQEVEVNDAEGYSFGKQKKSKEKGSKKSAKGKKKSSKAPPWK